MKREESVEGVDRRGERQAWYDSRAMKFAFLKFPFVLLLFFVSGAFGAEIGVRGKLFTVDGRSVFLLGCSYYSGIGAGEERLKNDLQELRNCGFNWIRVWGTWSAYGNDVSAVDGKSGKLRAEEFARLK